MDPASVLLQQRGADQARNEAMWQDTIKGLRQISDKTRDRSQREADYYAANLKKIRDMGIDPDSDEGRLMLEQLDDDRVAAEKEADRVNMPKWMQTIKGVLPEWAGGYRDSLGKDRRTQAEETYRQIGADEDAEIKKSVLTDLENNVNLPVRPENLKKRYPALSDTQISGILGDFNNRFNKETRAVYLGGDALKIPVGAQKTGGI